MNKLSLYTDEELVRLLQKNHAQSEQIFGEIYSRYSQKIYSYCLRVLENSDDANDAFQETFIKFYETVKKSTEINILNRMLIKIARNQCLNFKRAKRDDLQYEEYFIPIEDDSVESKEFLNLIDKALQYLDFEHREAFVLRLYQGLSYSEISEITGANISTLKNRFFRAKDKLKTILQPYLVEL
jgi:RNA polymerase sigma-70 factor (ECF subfamily)